MKCMHIHTYVNVDFPSEITVWIFFEKSDITKPNSQESKFSEKKKLINPPYSIKNNQQNA